jgi:glyoxylase-like metal-dependent hydrolase (beta-lactamase superfamily II)
MTMRPGVVRVCVAAAFAGLAGLALLMSRSEAEPGSLKQIVPGVWFREGDIANLGHCNNIIIEMKDYLIVVDANFPSGARLAMADAKKVSSKPVKYVFDTHHHGDHAYGNPVWTEAGAITLAHKGVVDEMKRVEPGRWQSTAKTRKDVAELNLPTAEPPKQTFEKSPYVMDDGSRRVEFHFFGWAHTRGDGFVYLPKEQVLCTGDAVANGPYNALMDANVANWPKVIQQARKLKVAHVLPGHGGAAGPEILSGQENFFLELHKSVKAAIDHGKKLDDIVKMDGGKPVSTSIQLPQSVKNWVGNGFPGQVRTTYQEITQNKPAAEVSGN